MSLDGSFKLPSAFRHFIDRCPDLESVPRLQYLLQKGDALTEEDVVSSIAELFLNPNYTIILISCFRTIARKIVDKAVDLLRLVPSLKSYPDDSSMEIDDDDKDVYIIEAYARNSKGMRLHELACLALCRARDLLPSLLPSVLSYFKFAPPPFQRLLSEVPTSQLIEKDVTHLLDAVQVTLRLLIVDPPVSKELWDWSAFSVDLRIGPEFSPSLCYIRWCKLQILSEYNNMGGRAITTAGFGNDEDFTCFSRWDQFCKDISLERAGWYLDMAEPERVCVDRGADFIRENCLQFGLTTPSLCLSQSNDVVSQRSNRRLVAWNEQFVDGPFVLTFAIKKSHDISLLAVSQKLPVLLYGPTGAGKTSLINELAKVSGNRVLFIHMDDQMDGKTLIGSYTCTDQPGEFRWQPGSLTQAVLSGLWVVFEDIDKAPSDVQTILSPLMESASQFVTGQGEAIDVAESFRLFATITSSKNDISHSLEGRTCLSVHWRRAMVQPPNKEDLLYILKARYPNLEMIADELVESFGNVNSFLSHQHEGFQSFGRFSTRDLLKWCKRIASLEFSPGLTLSAQERRSIYQEAVDIFAAFDACYETRLSLMKEMAKIWGISPAEAETLLSCRKPTIQELQSNLQVGRVALKQTGVGSQTRSFVDIRSSLCALERIACSVKYNEPVLLVGETGTGKTTLVQNLAARLSQPLTVLNLSQQSDVADLLGGFKPTDPLFICLPLYNEFMELFARTFSAKDNTDKGRFLDKLRNLRADKNWGRVLKAFQRALQTVRNHSKCEVENAAFGTKRKRPLGEDVLNAWEHFSVKLDAACRQIDSSCPMAFSFVEGAFITALRNGYWILLDEVNLAPPETLQRVMGVLEKESGSLCLAERGDVDYITRHPDFRLFACMNPATDAGKRDLPYSVRSRFTEYFVDEVMDDEELTLFVSKFMGDGHRNRGLVDKIVRFYKAAKKESEMRLQDGANQKPQFSLRSLYRAIEYLKKAEKEKFEFQRALYDGFCMFFLTLLDGPSAKFMNNMITSYLLEGKNPPKIPLENYLRVVGKSNSGCPMNNYIMTDSVMEHLKNVSRAILVKRHPVLLQGPTSSGKTSLVQYLASVTGHEFVRINNHEHTDLQEYLGSYITNASGKLVFQEGVLVKAVRNGFWIVLDELNLAPSDVLEALNRLLDDNRELFIPELQETVRAHPNFMLFATQNPPTFYGGRKMLSRAFRNRFVEIHIDEIPDTELAVILENRCAIPGSYASKMVEVMKDLQLHRQSSKVFSGKHGFITPRDLFRWAERFRTFGKSYEDLAKDGYFLLGERLRDENEKEIVQEILEKRLRVKLIKYDLYSQGRPCDLTTSNTSGDSGVAQHLGNIIWTESMQRLFFLVERCYKMREPVLLVGETGGGKTTVCQLLSTYLGSKLHILNCHQYTETSDFLGGFYPMRDRSKLTMEFKSLVEQLMMSDVFLKISGSAKLSTDIGEASLTLKQLNTIISSYKQGQVSYVNVKEGDLDIFEKAKTDLVQLHQKWQTVFAWQDGPLVEAMKHGDLFLVDEISLADDSVLERLNSLLEPERKLVLAEKGGSTLENVNAHSNFFLLATMNPGGDYGKKELSPALRNRFTEIWVPPVSDLNELKTIAQRFVGQTLSYTLDPMMEFWEWFNQLQTGRLLTVRDLLSWVNFMTATEGNFESSDYAFLHGAFLVLLDGLSLGSSISKLDAELLRGQCLSFLLKCLKGGNMSLEESQLSKMETYGWGDIGSTSSHVYNKLMQSDSHFGINPFCVPKGDEDCRLEGFEFLAPTTCRNTMRVLRAMQLAKPVLLEGSPGVGKTSLITALGKFSGHRVVRINLSEQTDIMDLVGSDLPVEDSEGMKFAWSDGILLQAIKNGSWVLLDELNLAPQSVLEGLNAILDHRAEVFIPELGLTFRCPASFRVFACQNPAGQGGGRKGLPKSFLNRFTKVYVDELIEEDYLFICRSLYPSIRKRLLRKLISFNKRLYEDTMISRKYGQDGSPWEFNLRDIIRSCQIIEGAPEKSKADCFLSVIYIQRMRSTADRKEVIKLYEDVFKVQPFINTYPRVHISSRHLIIGNSFVQRNHFQPSEFSKNHLSILPGVRYCLEAVLHCVQHQWLCILVGPSSSGKTSVVRLLAHLSGNVLNELNLSHGTDISDLLGSYEQYNAFRNFRSALSQVDRFIGEYCSLTLESSMNEFIDECKGLVSKCVVSLRSGSFRSVGLLIQIVEQMKLGMERNQLPVSWSMSDLDTVHEAFIKLQENYNRHAFQAKFEWVTGLLVKAIKFGEWIVLENANLCNPTVLDRLNSLVEPTGSITINEGGLVDGTPMVIHSHKQFRLFLSINPKYGEVSRAMRNRGVEVFMLESNCKLDGEDEYICKDADIRDVKRFLVLSGVPIRKLVDAMAEAHMYARENGLIFGVQITLLELTRWVQLFQQLLMNGNKASWSLQLSWEHSYLSSLGEGNGKQIVEQAKTYFLSDFNWSQFCEYSLSLPGGWPTPLRLKDLVWQSREAGVKQNCQYLEFLGAQYASYKISTSQNCTLMERDASIRTTTTTSLAFDHKQLQPSILPLEMLLRILFPKSSYQPTIRSDNLSKFDLEQAQNMLFFAANWVIEQATVEDWKLYSSWFRSYSSHVHPYCSFFKSYFIILEKVFVHPIWKCILDCRREIASYEDVVSMLSLPLLSLKLMEFISVNDKLGNDKLVNFSKRLHKAIKSMDLLFPSFQQWAAENDQNEKDEIFSPLLKSLQELEEEVLKNLADSSYFDVLYHSYKTLIEHHGLFWDAISSLKYENLVISWRFLEKDVNRLQVFFPNEVKKILVESQKLATMSGWSLQSVKSMLWVYGGHPVLPFSADVHSKLQQFLRLCELIWPKKPVLSNQSATFGKGYHVKTIISANKELRLLATQGVCMLSHIMQADDRDDSNMVKQLEEMHQMLLGRFENEKKKLEAVLASKDHTYTEENSACCVFFPENLYTDPKFNSWKETIPLFQNTSLSLDMELLGELSSSVFLDAEDLYMVLSNNYELLEFSMNFSLKYSARPPTDFLPHQKILWSLDAWESVDSANTNLASSILEMWFSWHSSLWVYIPECAANSLIDGRGSPVLHLLFHPTKTTTLEQMLHGALDIKDFSVNSMKFRVASMNFWNDSPSKRDLPDFFLSTARSLFQQIIYAHKKSFEEEKYAEIKSILSSFQSYEVKQESFQELSSLIGSSSHSGLIFIKDLLIMPLLKELYLHHASHDFLKNIGQAWFLVGGLRFHLLLTPDNLDPAIKYSVKYSHLLEQISLFELEVKVRQECESLVGRISTRDDLQQRARSREKLEMERRRLQRKVVFRHDPTKFTRLRSECADFIKLINSAAELMKNLNMTPMIKESIHWQETATSFIYRLSEEYTEYTDIIQPIQVALYEMKLGLSLVVGSALQKEFLNKIEEHTTDRVLETVYSFMRFPRSCAVPPICRDLGKCGHDHLFSDLDASANILDMDVTLLKRLCSMSRDTGCDKMVLVPQLHAGLYQNLLERITQYVGNSLLMGKASFKLLNEIFEQFAGFWMSVKVHKKAKEDNDAQNYTFKPREFKLEEILDVDISNLKDSLADESLCMEIEDLMADDACTASAPSQEHVNPEVEWNLIQESVLKKMVHIHNLLFGSINLIEQPGLVQISDVDRLSSFVESYTLGTGMIKVLPALLSSSLDAKLVPEHLLYLCSEYGNKFGPTLGLPSVNNFYKDANAFVLSKMVKPLVSLQKRVLSLLDQWIDHPGIKQILDIIEMLLAVPLSTPLAKALSGLQFLLRKVQMLEENDPKVSLSAQLQPLSSTVLYWQKMEVASWPALLEGVEEQYANNAGNLWFPLYSLLHREQTADVATHNQSTIQSLEDFIQTSSVGEFKRRLQLLLAFHGQFDMAIGFGFYSGPNQRILYNVFGYYVQFLPKVLEHIEVNKKNVAKDLKELVTLDKWEHRDIYLSIETSRRNRQKLRKLIQKFNDILQQPAIAIFNQDAIKSGIQLPSVQTPKISNGISGMDDVPPMLIDLNVFNDTRRTFWYDEWRKEVGSVSFLCPRTADAFEHLCLIDAGEIEGLMKKTSISQGACLIYQEEWNSIWLSLEKISQRVAECTDLWKEEKKSFGKRRALSDFIKLLESCGLSRHKYLVFEDALESNQRSSWFLQPSFEVQHLLLPPSGQAAIVSEIPSHSQFQENKYTDSDWTTSNRYFFRSMAQVQLLRQICLSFHKDFSLDQVTRSASFLEHLVLIQQEQRSIAYGFAKDLKKLRKCTTYLMKLDMKSSTADNGIESETTVSLNQKATYKCMWHQKQIFDTLCDTAQEAALFLTKVESSHLNTCEGVKVTANNVLVFIEKHIPSLQRAKESLNLDLLNGSQSLTTPDACSAPFVASKKMEQLIVQNFQEISDFEVHLVDFSKLAVDRRSAQEPLLCCFRDVLKKGKTIMEKFYSVSSRASGDDAFSDTLSSLKGSFAESFNQTLKLIKEAFQALLSPTHPKESVSGDITRWKVLAESCLENLQLQSIREELSETIRSAVKVIDYAGHEEHGLCLKIQTCLNRLYVWVESLMSLAYGLLHEILLMHRTVAEMTHMLAQVFSSLYSKGFGGEDLTDDTGGDLSQDASGTGMGEGAGLNDVSDQITDEDQLLGILEKTHEGPDSSKDVPSKDDKGIEMNQDFDAETFSVSEDSGDDNSENEDGADEDPESAMGDTGNDNEVVDEKLWDENEDGDPDNTQEKYESGPSVRDLNSKQRELRAKEDGLNDCGESEEFVANDDESNKDKNEDGSDHDENMNDVNMDKETAYTDPTGIEIDEENQGFGEEAEREEPEDTDRMEPEGPDIMEGSGPDDGEEGPEDQDEIADKGDENDSMTDLVDEDVKGTDSTAVGENIESDDPMKGNDGITAMDLSRPNKSASELQPSDFTGIPTQQKFTDDGETSKSNGMAQEAQLSNSRNMPNGYAPSKGLASSGVSEVELGMPDSVNGVNLTADETKAQSPEHDDASMPSVHPNPYRNVGDALEKWKERVKVSVDMPEHKTEASIDMEDDTADEYGFVSELEKGTSQALGPATSDQLDRNINGNKYNDDDVAQGKQEIPEMDLPKEVSETVPINSYSAHKQNGKQMQNSGISDAAPLERVVEDTDDGGSGNGPTSPSRNLVSFKNSYMNEEILRLGDLTVNDKELGKANGIEEVSDIKDTSTAPSRWNELLRISTKLSQELAEQLRLVMEPTLASKLQGDYKTGKRINMKKVIPYIASHYRKDKIWMRRTRPNKRDYQVIVAVDDSRSMSESRCGDVAIEALVTVCRAMAQLEVGQLAVASFGKKGNIKLLHDFDRPFTGESGMKMISSLTFKQENTIADEPVVDLLMYLNNKLDTAVTNARLPSGQNPLQQLILIIADGRFHEKEKLKCCVRDVLNKNRMVAFLLLDSPQAEESIMEVKEASFEGDKVIFTKYLDSFPFPYYIILKNIEALPRTLADLLRQWFELTQNGRD